MFGQDEKKGCALTPTTMIVLAIAFLWMFAAPKVYNMIRGTQPKQEQTEEERKQTARKRLAAALKDQAKVLREQGLENEAVELERSAENILAGKAGEEPPARAAAGATVTPVLTGAAPGQREPTGGPAPPQEPGEPVEPEKPEEPEGEALRIGPIETDQLLLEFNTLGASVERAALVKHHFMPGDDEPLDMLLPIGGLGGASNSFVLRAREDSTLAVDLSRRVWNLAEDTGRFDSRGWRTLVFRTRAGHIEFVKTYTLYKTGHVFEVEVEVRNTGTALVAGLDLDLIAMNGLAPDDKPGRYWSLEATLAGRRADDASISTRKLNAGTLVGKGVEGLKNFEERSYSPPVKEWAALTNHYFAAVFQVLDSDGVEAMYVEPVVFEAAVRYCLADMDVGERVSFYRRDVSDLAVHEALRRWDAGVRVANPDSFEPSVVRNSDVLVYKRTNTVVKGGDVALTTDGASKPGRDYGADPLLGAPNLAVAVSLDVGKLAANESKSFRFRAYLGPLQTGTLAQAGGAAEWGSLVSFGWFGWLSKLLLMLLNGIYFFTGLLPDVIGGYGLAIFFLTLAVKGGLHPLQRKAMVSMHKMQALAPEMKAIKKRYEKDKSREGQRKMQLELMELYKKHGVSPLGGCFPMLVQLPMFFALFGMLRGAFELRHQGYLWIADLTSPDRLISLTPFKLPLLGWEVDAINLLPVLYLGLILLQQHLSPKSEDPQVRQQQSMMKFMMIFFFLIFYKMPSGLVIYFVFSNGLGILEQWYIRKHIIPAATGAGDGSTGEYKMTIDAPAPKTSWEKAEEKAKRKAEKRKKRDQRRPPTA